MTMVSVHVGRVRPDWWRPADFDTLQSHLLRAKLMQPPAMAMARLVVLAIRKRRRTEGAAWLPCPAPTWDAGGTYRVVERYGGPAIERVNQ